eukprot:scaffold99373_cov30-Phaeocystis_antarctica.AAC.1
MSWDRDGCMPNVAQSVGTSTAAADCHAEAHAPKRVQRATGCCSSPGIARRTSSTLQSAGARAATRCR